MFTIENKVIFKESNNFRFDVPISIEVEITEQCNFKCPFCYNNSIYKSFNEQREDILEKWMPLFNRIIELGGVFQLILSGGEPLLFKDSIYEILNLFNNDGTGLLLITNGYYLDEEFVKKIQYMNWYWIQISLDSYKRENHDRIRGLSGAFEHAVSGLQLLKKYNIPTAISTVVMPQEIENIEKMVRLGIQLNADAILVSEAMPVGRARTKKTDYGFDLSQRQRYNEIVDICKEKYGDKIIIKKALSYEEQIKEDKNKIPFGFLIRPNGDVKLNCLTDDIEGNVFMQTYEDIWSKVTEKYKERQFYENEH